MINKTENPLDRITLIEIPIIAGFSLTMMSTLVLKDKTTLISTEGKIERSNTITGSLIILATTIKAAEILDTINKTDMTRIIATHNKVVLFLATSRRNLQVDK